MLKDATHYAARLHRGHRARAAEHARRGSILGIVGGLADRLGEAPPYVDVGTAPTEPVPPGRGAEWCAQLVDVDVPPPTHIARDELAVYVRVDHGRWVADCPCGSAQLACMTDLRLFCVDCGNAHADGRWVKTIWPTSTVEIDRVLSLRPLPYQNWTADESVPQLRAENMLLMAGSPEDIAAIAGVEPPVLGSSRREITR